MEFVTQRNREEVRPRHRRAEEPRGDRLCEQWYLHFLEAMCVKLALQLGPILRLRFPSLLAASSKLAHLDALRPCVVVEQPLTDEGVHESLARVGYSCFGEVRCRIMDDGLAFSPFFQLLAFSVDLYPNSLLCMI